MLTEVGCECLSSTDIVLEGSIRFPLPLISRHPGMNNPSLHSLFHLQHCLIFNWIFSGFSLQMLGVDLPFSAKLKSLLAPAVLL